MMPTPVRRDAVSYRADLAYGTVNVKDRSLSEDFHKSYHALDATLTLSAAQLYVFRSNA